MMETAKGPMVGRVRVREREQTWKNKKNVRMVKIVLYNKI